MHWDRADRQAAAAGRLGAARLLVLKVEQQEEQ